MLLTVFQNLPNCDVRSIRHYTELGLPRQIIARIELCCQRRFVVT